MVGLVVVGVPGDARATGLTRALEAARRAPPLFVSWKDVLDDPERARIGTKGDFLRVESPGSDAATWHALARRGGFEGTIAHGQWRPGRAWFDGLRATLGAIERATPHLTATHPTADVLAMTDKLACDAILRRAGVPVPDTFEAPADLAALHARLARDAMHAVFVKPRWGSSGAGVLAYRWTRDRAQLVTTAALGAQVVNHKRLRTYEDRASIDRLLALVIADGAIVQRWIPKAGAAQGPFDLRVLVVDGRIAQRVARVGRGTITNLHLDAARLDADEALAAFSESARAATWDACRRAAACFPDHHAVGIDVMLDPRGRPFVLECNAWGDHLPRLLADGLDSYGVQMRALFEAA